MKRRLIGLLLAVCLLLSGMPAFAAEGITVERVSGDNRYLTAVETSKKAFEKSENVVIASGESFPDALVGGTLAIQIAAPMLLTQKSGVPEGLIEELNRLEVKKIYLIGGENTIDKNVEEILAKSATVERVAGLDRADTAGKILSLRNRLNGYDNEDYRESCSYAVNGFNFPDALTAAPLVGRVIKADSFVDFLSLRDEVKDDFPGVVIGGANSVKGNAEKRIAGADRYATALAVAKEYEAKFGDFKTVILVDGTNFPDALAASGLSGMQKAPILLTRPGSLDLETLKYIKENAEKVILVGGENSINNSVISEITYGKSSNFELLKDRLESLTKKNYQTIATGDEKMDMITLLLEDYDMLELADVFTKEKSDRILKDVKLPETLGDKYLAKIAALVTVTKLTPEDMAGFFADAETGTDYIDKLVDALHGDYTHGPELKGMIDDVDIYRYLPKAFGEVKLFLNNDMLATGIKGVTEKLSTGFNIKRTEDNADYKPELSLRYGHSDIKHAMQLIGLLKSEGIEGRVWVEPKTSAFVYLLEWGPVPDPTETYEVVRVKEDLYVAHALEFDMVFEFKTEEEKNAFDGIINKYAKKSSANPTGKGMIYGAWWQPLYTSETEMTEGYKSIVDNYMAKDGYELHSFTKPQDSEAFVNGYKKLDSSLDIKVKPLWCDDAFFRYLGGESE